jgi:uncharacterized SAM-binding protein YcdF (DUF218 family)
MNSAADEFGVRPECESRFETWGDQVFVADRVIPADVAIVFGVTTWKRPAARAVELHRAGLARRLLFTGGFNARIGAVEAREMAREAMTLGVPASDILVEDRAANTSENLAFSRLILEKALGLDGVASIMLVAIQFHMRRVLMTAERTFPPRIAIATASYPSVAYSARDWRGSPRGRRDVASEIRKIRLYLDPAWPGEAG